MAPVVLVALLVTPLGLAAPAHRLAAVLSMMFVLWVTEALPLAVTALIGPVLIILLQVAPARAAMSRRRAVGLRPTTVIVTSPAAARMRGRIASAR